MAAEIQIIDEGAAQVQVIGEESSVNVSDGNSAVVKVNDALSEAEQTMEEVRANHVELFLDPDTNEFYAEYGVD